jgi:hypothetical protein
MATEAREGLPGLVDKPVEPGEKRESFFGENLVFNVYGGLVSAYFLLREGYFEGREKFDIWVDAKLAELQGKVDQLESEKSGPEDGI